MMDHLPAGPVRLDPSVSRPFDAATPQMT